MEIDWKSVAREGNPLTEGDYFVTIINASAFKKNKTEVHGKEAIGFLKQVSL